MLRTIRRVDWLQLLFVQNRWLAVLAAVSLSILVGLAGGWLVAAAGPFMTAALVVGVAGGLWMLRDIEVGYWALVAVICLLPFGKLPFDVGFKPSFLDVVVGVLFVIWVMELMLGPSRERHRHLDAVTYGGRRPVTTQFIGTRLGLPVFIFSVLAVVAFVAGLAHAPLTQQVARHFAEVILGILLFFVVGFAFCVNGKHVAGQVCSECHLPARLRQNTVLRNSNYERFDGPSTQLLDDTI